MTISLNEKKEHKRNTFSFWKYGVLHRTFAKKDIKLNSDVFLLFSNNGALKHG